MTGTVSGETVRSAPQPRPLRVLVVEDSDDDYQILLREMARRGFAPDALRVSTGAALQRALADAAWQLVVTDWVLPGFDGAAAIALARAAGVPCIVISGTPSEAAAVEALRAGALDFVSKDKPAMFVPAIERALRESIEHDARVAAERELRLSEARYRAAFELAPEAIITYDLEQQRIVDTNASAQRMFGYSRAELAALELGALSPPVQPDGRASRELAREQLARVAAGETIELEWTSRDARGAELPTEVRLTLLPSSRDQLVRASFVDLRERRRAEEARRRAEELELANRRIQEANRLKSEFLANMSHELRTPLNAIIGFAQVLHDRQVEPASPQHDEFLADILTSARHLLQLINDVLDLAKVEAGRLDFRPETIELAQVVAEVVAITRATAAAKRIGVTIDVDASLVAIELDPDRFKQVLYNFLSNALKFTPEGGRVIVRALPDDNTTFRLEVEDTGVGIAAEDLGRLFVEFQQLEAGAAKRHQGTGLGLALARRLVEAQGGSVGVRSTPGKGSIFHATLPRRARGGAA
jgi:PAS domain S-box-containing protein